MKLVRPAGQLTSSETGSGRRTVIYSTADCLPGHGECEIKIVSLLSRLLPAVLRRTFERP
jgi:hypothetical protein